MRIYLAYKLSNRDFKEVKKRLIEVDEILKDLGHKTFIFVRDIQNWKPKGEPKEIMKEAMKNMKKCDVLLAIVETQEKGEGLLLESGFMKGIGKKVIVAVGKEGRANLLKGIADDIFEFEEMGEFSNKIKQHL